MADPHLDHPGDWHWFRGYGPVPIKGPCSHTNCPHNALTVIAYGPDYDHYELVICDVDKGCNGNCRGWTREYPYFEAKELGIPVMTLPENHLGWSEVVVSHG